MRLEVPAAQATGPARQTVGDWWQARARARQRRTSGPPGCTIAIASILGRMWCVEALSDDALKATAASAVQCGTQGTALCCSMQRKQHSSRIRWGEQTRLRPPRRHCFSDVLGSNASVTHMCVANRRDLLAAKMVKVQSDHLPPLAVW